MKTITLVADIVERYPGGSERHFEGRATYSDGTIGRVWAVAPADWDGDQALVWRSPKPETDEPGRVVWSSDDPSGFNLENVPAAYQGLVRGIVEMVDRKRKEKHANQA